MTEKEMGDNDKSLNFREFCVEWCLVGGNSIDKEFPVAIQTIDGTLV